jgi:hypothetical protein
VNKEQIVPVLILMGLFDGLVGGPIAILLDYHAPPVKRFWLFIIIPEFIGFTFAVLLMAQKIYAITKKYGSRISTNISYG